MSTPLRPEEGRQDPYWAVDVFALERGHAIARYLVFLAGFFAFLAFAGFLALLLAGDFLPAGIITSFLSRSR